MFRRHALNEGGLVAHRVHLAQRIFVVEQANIAGGKLRSVSRSLSSLPFSVRRQ